MSRIVVYNLDGTSAGEIHANCTRGWAISDGGKATVTLSNADAVKPWLQFGRMAMITHPRLPSWAGMIDTPWDALPPATMTLYNCEYLLSLRTPDVQYQLKGPAGKMAMHLVNSANGQEDLRIRAGEIDESLPARDEETYEMRPIWEQLVQLMKRAGTEMQMRPDTDNANRLVVYLDVAKRLGKSTNFLLHDGPNANMQITAAEVTGVIYNRILGTSTGAKPGEALKTDPFLDDESIQQYRMRSKVQQYQNTGTLSALRANVRAELETAAQPMLKLTVNVLDVGDAFSNARLGNTAFVHASGLILPGGIRGWKGLARILAMVYDESKNGLSMVLMGAL